MVARIAPLTTELGPLVHCPFVVGTVVILAGCIVSHSHYAVHSVTNRLCLCLAVR